MRSASAVYVPSIIYKLFEIKLGIRLNVKLMSTSLSELKIQLPFGAEDGGE